MFKEDVPNEILTDLIQGGYIKLVDKSYELTDKGKDEKNRLCTLAGLNILYQSEKKVAKV